MVVTKVEPIRLRNKDGDDDHEKPIFLAAKNWAQKSIC